MFTRSKQEPTKASISLELRRVLSGERSSQEVPLTEEEVALVALHEESEGI